MTSQNTAVHNLSAPQAAEILRASAALIADQISNALPKMFGPALERLATRTDSDTGAAGARRMLSVRRDDFRRKFASYLKEGQQEALGRLLKQDRRVSGALSFTADSLSLVDDEADVPAEAVAKVVRRMRGMLERQARDLQMVAAFLAGRESIRADDDPFAPEVFMTSVLNAARDLDLEPSGWDVLLEALERPMTDELIRSHEALAEHFRRHRIEPADIRREMAARQALSRPTLGGPTLGAATLGASTLGAPTVGDITVSPFTETPSTLARPTQRATGNRFGWMESVAGISGVSPASELAGGAMSASEVRGSLQTMIQRLSAAGRGAPLPAMPATGKPPAGLITAIDEMQRIGAQAAAGQPFPEGLAAGDQDAWRDLLLAKSTRTVDKLTIEIVGMVFESVLQDAQVPPEIKAILSRLQFPVLKVALTDAEFFASSGHPARRLIDRLASTAMGWEPYGDENQRYKAEVERIVQQVLERFDKDMGTFEQLLVEFEAFLAEMPVRDTDPVARAKRALEEAEKREVLAINTTIQVRRAFEHVELEPFLREFLVGPWVQALVSATLRDEQTPGFSKAFRHVIHDLVWSVQPKISTDERKRLVAVIPAMTRVLRDGMSMVQMPEVNQQSFLKDLMRSHAMAVRTVDQATYIKARVATGELKQKIDQMQITGSVPISGAAGGVHVSANAVRRAAEHHAAQFVIPEPPAGATPLTEEQAANFDAQIAGWQRGNWFSLYDGEQTIKVKLRWISPLRTLFMFAGSDDKNTRVLSPETIKSYLKQGWMKPLEAESLMKRAVDRVVEELERSPKRAEELAEKVGATTAPKAEA
jgi:Protein of unknown function (DUF1631)